MQLYLLGFCSVVVQFNLLSSLLFRQLKSFGIYLPAVISVSCSVFGKLKEQFETNLSAVR